MLRLDPKSLDAVVDADAMWRRDAPPCKVGSSEASGSEMAGVKAELAALRAQVCRESSGECVHGNFGGNPR